jgi:membrane fusion protein, multidrug efflux system
MHPERLALWAVTSTLMVLLLQGCEEVAVETPQPPPRPAKLFEVKASSKEAERRYPAVVEAFEKTNLSFRVPGTVTVLIVNQGQEVKKGDLIARLDSRDYELALNQATSQLQETQANERAMKIGVRPEDIQILENNFRQAKTESERDERFFNERKGLIEKGAITREELETAEATFKVSKAKFETAKKELEKGKTGARKEDIEAIEARVRILKDNIKNAENALADTRLFAPYTARVIDKFVDKFQEVQSKQPIVSLQQIETVKLAFGLPESVVFKLERGNIGNFSAVLIHLPEQEFPVDMKEFRLEADPKTRTFTCWAKMSPPKGVTLLPGMTAEVIHRDPHGELPGVEVPSNAVFADENKNHFVWVVDKADMTVDRTPVEAGSLSGQSIRVTKGLKEGDLIVATGVHYLTDGMKVYSLDSKE